MSQHDKNIRKKHLAHMIKKLPFPATKKRIVEYMRTAGSGDDIVDVFSELPSKTYEKTAEVEHEIYAILERKS